MKKSPSVFYVHRKIRTTGKSELLKQIEECPLTDLDRELVRAMISGLSIKELSGKFCKSASRISQWKRETCEKIHAFDIANAKR